MRQQQQQQQWGGRTPPHPTAPRRPPCPMRGPAAAAPLPNRAAAACPTPQAARPCRSEASSRAGCTPPTPTPASRVGWQLGSSPGPGAGPARLKRSCPRRPRRRARVCRETQAQWQCAPAASRWVGLRAICWLVLAGEALCLQCRSYILRGHSTGAASRPRAVCRPPARCVLQVSTPRPANSYSRSDSSKAYSRSDSSNAYSRSDSSNAYSRSDSNAYSRSDSQNSAGSTASVQSDVIPEFSLWGGPPAGAAGASASAPSSSFYAELQLAASASFPGLAASASSAPGAAMAAATIAAGSSVQALAPPGTAAYDRSPALLPGPSALASSSYSLLPLQSSLLSQLSASSGSGTAAALYALSALSHSSSFSRGMAAQLPAPAMVSAGSVAGPVSAAYPSLLNVAAAFPGLGALASTLSATPQAPYSVPPNSPLVQVPLHLGTGANLSGLQQQQQQQQQLCTEFLQHCHLRSAGAQ